MFHLIAWWQNVDLAGVFGPLDAVADPVVFSTGDDIRVPEFAPQLVAAAAIIGSGGTGRARIDSPSLRDIANVDIQPINGGNDGDAEPSSPHLVHDLRANPLPLEPGESLNAQADSNTTAAADQSVLAWLADGPIEPIKGQAIHSVRATGGITAVAGAWTNGALTFAQTLPFGNYQVVGMRAEGATMIAARLVFPGLAHRPGVMGCDADTDSEHPMFRLGGLGVFGEFQSTVPPTVDVLCNDADTAQEFILDLIAVG